MSQGVRWNSPDVYVGYHLSGLADFGPTGYTLTNNDGVTFPVDGFGNGSANFVGGTRYLYRGATGPTDTDFSISFWIKFTTVVAGTNYGILRWVSMSGTYRYTRIILSRDGSSNYTLSVAPSTTSLISYVIPNFTYGKWYHVVVTRAASGGAIKVYLNGNQVASGSSGSSSFTTASLYLGTDAINNALIGRMDEFVIYKTVKSASDVRRLYSDGKGMLV
jgi:hypothetical protein